MRPHRVYVRRALLEEARTLIARRLGTHRGTDQYRGFGDSYHGPGRNRFRIPLAPEDSEFQNDVRHALMAAVEEDRRRCTRQIPNPAYRSGRAEEVQAEKKEEEEKGEQEEVEIDAGGGFASIGRLDEKESPTIDYYEEPALILMGHSLGTIATTHACIEAEERSQIELGLQKEMITDGDKHPVDRHVMSPRAVILEAPLDSIEGVCASYLGLGIAKYFNV